MPNNNDTNGEWERVANDALFGSFDHAAHYEQPEKWEKAWLNNETDWWPDSLEDLPGDIIHAVRAGCPSSPMPRKAQDRINALRDAGKQYVVHVDTGIHAYRVGFARDFLPNARDLAPPP